MFLDGTVSDPWFLTDTGAKEFENLKKYFQSPIKAQFKPGVTPKNLIEIIPESFELQFLGAYNRRGYKKSMPYLSALSKNTTFFPNVDVGVKTSWSSGSIFASQCGLPLVCSPDRGNNAEMLKRLNKVKCAGDYFKKLGYRNVAIYPGDADFGGIRPTLITHGFENFIHYRQGVRNDAKLMEYLEKWFPKVVKESKAE